MAATLAVGDGTLLSHRFAAELWGVGPELCGAVEVTSVGRRGRSRDGITVHSARRLAPADATTHHGIPVTAPGRTLLDLATVVGRRDLARAVEQAEVLDLLRGDWLDPLLTRNPRHRGTRPLRAVTQAADAPAMTRSEAERRLRELVRAAGLPHPEVKSPTAWLRSRLRLARPASRRRSRRLRLPLIAQFVRAGSASRCGAHREGLQSDPGHLAPAHPRA